MSMLAERKQKQRWSLNPRGKHWSEDVNKFGHKMLEKMGWSAGKGLGAHEDGITEHVKVSYKNDAKGMGFKDNGEQWTKHEDNFTSLLANLGAGNEAKQITLPKPEKSLEKKSQSTKARVHYHKFTRGKDLATRSEKDIANIFGRKTLERPVEQKGETQDEVENGTEDKSFGVVTVKAGNMADYFKSKLGKIGNFSSSKGDYDLNDHDDYESEIGACTGFGFASVNEKNEEKDAATTTSLGFNKVNFVSSQNNTTIETKNNKRKRNDSEDLAEVTTKKKKKSKKNQMAFDNLGSDINPAEEVCYDNPGLNPTDSPLQNNEQTRKKKHVTFSSPIIEVLNKSDESDKKQKSKKKKKNKQTTNGIDNFGCDDNSFQESVQMSNEENEKKSKKKKKRDLSNSNETPMDDDTPSKKKKKHEQAGIDNLACEEISVNEKNEEIKRYKLKKKAMEHGLVNPACVANDNSIEEKEQSPKKKKKKSKENQLNNSECEEHSILEETEVVQKKKSKKQKNKSEDSLDVSNISEVSQNDDEVKSKKNKKNKKITEEDNIETSPKKLKKKSKSKESGIENLGCEINTVEENIASINSEIDNYQNELENELNVKKIKKQKKEKNQNPPEETSEESQNQNSPKKSKDNIVVDNNEQSTNGESNFQKNSEFNRKSFGDENSGNQTSNNHMDNRRQGFNNRNNRFNNGQRGSNNFNNNRMDNRRQSFNDRFDSQKGPNNFNNNRMDNRQQSFNDRFDGQRGPNNFNNRSFNNQRRGGRNNFFGRVDKSSVKHILKPGELKLNFAGSNLMKLSGYGVHHELIGKTPRPEAKPELNTESNPEPSPET